MCVFLRERVDIILYLRMGIIHLFHPRCIFQHFKKKNKYGRLDICCHLYIHIQTCEKHSSKFITSLRHLFFNRSCLTFRHFLISPLLTPTICAPHSSSSSLFFFAFPINMFMYCVNIFNTLWGSHQQYATMFYSCLEKVARKSCKKGAREIKFISNFSLAELELFFWMC